MPAPLGLIVTVGLSDCYLRLCFDHFSSMTSTDNSRKQRYSCVGSVRENRLKRLDLCCLICDSNIESTLSCDRLSDAREGLVDATVDSDLLPVRPSASFTFNT